MLCFFHRQPCGCYVSFIDSPVDDVCYVSLIDSPVDDVCYVSLIDSPVDDVCIREIYIHNVLWCYLHAYIKCIYKSA